MDDNKTSNKPLTYKEFEKNYKSEMPEDDFAKGGLTDGDYQTLARRLHNAVSSIKGTDEDEIEAVANILEKRFKNPRSRSKAINAINEKFTTLSGGEGLREALTDDYNNWDFGKGDEDAIIGRFGYAEHDFFTDSKEESDAMNGNMGGVEESNFSNIGRDGEFKSERDIQVQDAYDDYLQEQENKPQTDEVPVAPVAGPAPAAPAPTEAPNETGPGLPEPPGGDTSPAYEYLTEQPTAPEEGHGFAPGDYRPEQHPEGTSTESDVTFSDTYLDGSGNLTRDELRKEAKVPDMPEMPDSEGGDFFGLVEKYQMAVMARNLVLGENEKIRAYNDKRELDAQKSNERTRNEATIQPDLAQKRIGTDKRGRPIHESSSDAFAGQVAGRERARNAQQDGKTLKSFNDMRDEPDSAGMRAWYRKRNAEEGGNRDNPYGGKSFDALEPQEQVKLHQFYKNSTPEQRQGASGPRGMQGQSGRNFNSSNLSYESQIENAIAGRKANYNWVEPSEDDPYAHLTNPFTDRGLEKAAQDRETSRRRASISQMPIAERLAMADKEQEEKMASSIRERMGQSGGKGYATSKFGGALGGAAFGLWSEGQVDPTNVDNIPRPEAGGEEYTPEMIANLEEQMGIASAIEGFEGDHAWEPHLPAGIDESELQDEQLVLPDGQEIPALPEGPSVGDFFREGQAEYDNARNPYSSSYDIGTSQPAPDNFSGAPIEEFFSQPGGQGVAEFFGQGAGPSVEDFFRQEEEEELKRRAAASMSVGDFFNQSEVPSYDYGPMDYESY